MMTRELPRIRCARRSPEIWLATSACLILVIDAYVERRGAPDCNGDHAGAAVGVALTGEYGLTGSVIAVPRPVRGRIRWLGF